MKKIMYFAVCILVLVTTSNLFADGEKEHQRFSVAFTSGYVFKHDCEFKEVYGHGIINIITADGCYYPWKHGGIGAKLSYWRAKGKTTFLNEPTLLQEVPFTLYLRGIKRFACDLALYGSLGGGLIWTQEKQRLDCIFFCIPNFAVSVIKGIGEAEVGFDYPIFKCVSITGAFRYLFPSQSFKSERADFGGFDLRAGIGFAF